jgi:hypothetical protein
MILNRFKGFWLHGLAAIWLWLLLFMVGCSSLASTVEKTSEKMGYQTQKIVRQISPFKSNLKRFLAVYRFENKALMAGKSFQPVFQEGIIRRLENECSTIVALPAEKIDQLSRLDTLPRLPSGALDNFALAQMGRQIGLNAIAVGALNNINLTKEIQGVFSKEAHYFIQVTIRLQVFDTETATKIFDEIFDRQMEIEEMDYTSVQTNQQVSMDWLHDAFEEMITKMANRLCDALFNLSWAGFVVGTEGNLIQLSSGSRVGLKPGLALDVFDSSEIITGVSGQRYIVPGLKIGEIKLKSVFPDRSEAEPVSGHDIPTGAILREKD